MHTIITGSHVNRTVNIVLFIPGEIDRPTASWADISSEKLQQS